MVSLPRLGALLLALAATSSLDEVLVIYSGPFSDPIDILSPEFEALASCHINATTGRSYGNSTESIPVRLAQGEIADIIILAKTSCDALVANGLVDPSSVVDLAISQIGMASQIGAPTPKIDTVENFNATLVRASSIAISGSASGTYFEEQLFPLLGIAGIVADRIVKSSEKYVGNMVAREEAEFGFQQLSELMQVSGIDIVGPIPADLQLNTTYSIAIPASAINVPAATQLIEFFRSPEHAAVIEAAGLLPIAPVRDPIAASKRVVVA